MEGFCDYFDAIFKYHKHVSSGDVFVHHKPGLPLSSYPGPLAQCQSEPAWINRNVRKSTQFIQKKLWKKYSLDNKLIIPQQGCILRHKHTPLWVPLTVPSSMETKFPGLGSKYLRHMNVLVFLIQFMCTWWITAQLLPLKWSFQSFFRQWSRCPYSDNTKYQI